MNAKLVEEIANAVLYEGYMLYPYRPSSVKNRQRWNFGVVYPKAYCEMQSGADNWFMQTECLAMGSSTSELGVKVRFLQAVARTVGEVKPPSDEWPAKTASGQEHDFRVDQALEIGDRTLQTWQEAAECEIVLPPLGVGDCDSPVFSGDFVFPGGREVEHVRGTDGRVHGLLIRTKEVVASKVEVMAACIKDGLFKITVRVLNIAKDAGQSALCREEALMQSLLSTHTILNIFNGEFVSLLDPPESLKEIMSECNNVGTWPVMAGEEGQRDGMLSSPIILYDYPQIAPESPGNLFDGTEIDEILALRILTLTEEEKREMRHADEHARQILERTEAVPAEHFMKLHGVLRALRPPNEEKQ